MQYGGEVGFVFSSTIVSKMMRSEKRCVCTELILFYMRGRKEGTFRYSPYLLWFPNVFNEIFPVSATLSRI